jgi:hypothetical protein
VAGLWLMQSAFNAAPLHMSLPGIAAAEPASGIVLGIIVFRDSVHVSPGTIALEASGLIALLVGVIMVVQAPALARLRRRHPPHPGTTRQAAHQARGSLRDDPWEMFERPGPGS